MFKTSFAAFALACSVTSAQAAVVDSFAMDVTTPSGTNSSAVLSAGVDYLIEVSGTFSLSNAPTRLADAEYFDVPSAPTNTSGSFDIGVQINGADIAWGAYNASNVYTTLFTGLGSTVNLALFDTPGTYGDNSGSLTVTISDIAPVPLPAGLPLLAVGLAGLAMMRRKG